MPDASFKFGGDDPLEMASVPGVGEDVGGAQSLQHRNLRGTEFAKPLEQPLIGANHGDPEVIVGSVATDGLLGSDPPSIWPRVILRRVMH